MKSKIWIDVDFDNQPVIRIRWEETDDLRDKMVKRFLEAFGGDSCWARFNFDQSVFDPDFPSKPANQNAILRPITRDRFKDEADAMMAQYKYNEEKR